MTGKPTADLLSSAKGGDRFAFDELVGRFFNDAFRLKEWMETQFAEHKVEPNSGLGRALRYLQNHWEKLTLFLRVAAAPIDNNIVERGLKKAILQRKNSLFYKTENGAAVGDMFMSFIHTCELNGANAYDYLTQLQKHPEEVSRNAARWMPWNYREALQALELGEPPPFCAAAS
jgi:transposase